ncbi:hypothetical protein GXB78_26830 [Pseudomonas moraviensis subsp. stanleyae]|uniref:DUF6896 domain-containing protein n=1 Tax=Pseudomonas moraviensis TaxID=321662 RepID=UPI002E3649FC|nr:hypothetical protein [Pseudomonas moraviensis]MED7670820.1 hypothetical protein [Pseudomonas moraviensis subsp. stanleyae]
MNKQRNDIVYLINDFLAKVENATVLLEKKFGTRNILRLWRSNQIQRCGDITSETQYELHGVGCIVHFATESVNFDYGFNSRTDGFDVWRLYIYALDRPLTYKKFCDKKILEKEFDELILSKKIEKMSASDSLYVLTGDPHC